MTLNPDGDYPFFTVPARHVREVTDAEVALIAKGYDLDALERDNPHNQWMNTDA